MSIMIELRPECGPVLIVGGGKVAERKASVVSSGEFTITVIAPEIRDRIHNLPFVTIHERVFAPGDIPGEPRWSLVMACTDDRAVNQEVGRLARAADIPVLVADRQAESTFFTPATIQDGELKVAVSTGGASPELAKFIRERVVSALGPRWGGIVHVARVEREERLAKKRQGSQ
ncbi:MAG: bifunctional precorrin-2 dehydrogenase/sirohydrochlorin ferrochelatase [Dehalococcoidia bacterium]